MTSSRKGKIKQTLALFIFIEILLPSFIIKTAFGGGEVIVKPPEIQLISGEDIPEKAPEFFERLLEKLGIPLSDFAVKALVIWTRYENTKAYWNPLATTWDMREKSWNFNEAGVKNYADMETGVQATANTLKLSYYKAILEMLAGKAFNKEEIQRAVATWTYGPKNAVNRMNDPYIVNLVNEWWSEWQAKVPAKPPFEIVKCDISPKEAGIGEKISVSVLIKNNDDVERTFYGILHIKDPEGNERELPGYGTVNIGPKAFSVMTFSWTIGEEYLIGEYDISLVVFAKGLEGKIVPIPNAFKIITSLYDQKSLFYKNRYKATYLISITREEMEENRRDIEDKLKKPLRTAIMKAPLEVIKICLKEALEKLAGEYGPATGLITEIAEDIMEGKYKDVPKDLAKEIIKDSFLLELKDMLIAQGVSAAEAALLAKAVGIAIALGIPIGAALDIVYGPYPIMKQDISYGIEFMHYTLATQGHVNFIIKKIGQNEFDIYLISYEKILVAGRVDKNPGEAIPYYIGRYDQLPYIFLRKIQESGSW